MNTIDPRIIPILAALALAGGAQAAPGEAASAAKADVRTQIANRLEIKVEDVRPSPVTGLFEVRAGAEVGYVSTDGKYYVDGDLFDMASKRNVTEEARKAGRIELLATIKDSDTIIFAPKGGAKHTVTVFTDVDCVHCRRLHSDMAELNRLGIRVRYLMYPRTGPDSDSWNKAVSVWCSADRRSALTRAKKGEDLPAGKCAAPVASQYELGRKLGVSGTPGIITETGEYLAGYGTAADLAAYLNEPAAVASASD